MALPETPNKHRSTRHHVVDERYATILSSDFPALPAEVILDALGGEPQKQAIAVSAWAAKQDQPARALLAWARKHRRGRRRRCAGASPRPPRNARRHGRGRDIPARRDVPPDGLRGVRCDPDALDRLAERLGV